MKILVLADARSFHTERFVSELKNQNCDVKLLSLEKGEIEHHLLKKKGSIKQFHYYRSISEICKIADSYNPDIISSHFVSGYGHIASKVSKKKKIPYTVHLWGSDILLVPKKSILHRWKTIQGLKGASFVFGDSNYLIDEAKKLFDFQNSILNVWGIERKFLSMHKTNYKLIEPLRILVPRVHENVYNNLFIVEALQELVVNNKITLTFPAFGSKYNEFKTHAEQLVGDRINYYCKKLRADYLQYSSTFDIYLSASKSDSSPVSLIESMALGLIPVAADIEGVKEWLIESSGFLFKQNNKQSLVNVINEILLFQSDFSDLRLDNKKSVEMKGIFEDSVMDQISIFKAIVEGKYV